MCAATWVHDASSPVVRPRHGQGDAEIALPSDGLGNDVARRVLGLVEVAEDLRGAILGEERTRAYDARRRGRRIASPRRRCPPRRRVGRVDLAAPEHGRRRRAGRARTRSRAAAPKRAARPLPRPCRAPSRGAAPSCRTQASLAASARTERVTPCSPARRRSGAFCRRNRRNTNCRPRSSASSARTPSSAMAKSRTHELRVDEPLESHGVVAADRPAARGGASRWHIRTAERCGRWILHRHRRSCSRRCRDKRHRLRGKRRRMRSATSFRARPSSECKRVEMSARQIMDVSPRRGRGHGATRRTPPSDWVSRFATPASTRRPARSTHALFGRGAAPRRAIRQSPATTASTAGVELLAVRRSR